VPGTCTIDVRTQRAKVVVELREQWSSDEFRYAGTPRHRLLRHTWRYVVSPSGRNIHFSSSGAFPPELVR